MSLVLTQESEERLRQVIDDKEVSVIITALHVLSNLGIKLKLTPEYMDTFAAGLGRKWSDRDNKYYFLGDAAFAHELRARTILKNNFFRTTNVDGLGETRPEVPYLKVLPAHEILHLAWWFDFIQTLTQTTFNPIAFLDDFAASRGYVWKEELRSYTQA